MGSLLVRLAGAPIVRLIAYRAGQSSSHFMRAAQELEEARAKRLVLRRLGVDATGLLIGDLLEARADEGSLRLVNSAHGIPFFLIELLRGLLDEGLVRVEGGNASLVENRLPSRVRARVRERLEERRTGRNRCLSARPEVPARRPGQSVC